MWWIWPNDRVQDFLVEYLDDTYDDPKELRENIENIEVSKKRLFGKRKSSLFPDKLIVFLYSKMIRFCETDKFNGIPILRRFVENLLGIKNENYVIHHSHVTGEMLGFAHHYCNEKVRENYFKIPVIVHILFKFDFFFLTERFKIWRLENKRC